MALSAMRPTTIVGAKIGSGTSCRKEVGSRKENIMKKITALSVLACCLGACSGMQRTGDTFTVHAESLNLVGFQFPGGEYSKARSMVPAGADIHTVTSGPSDLTSVVGVFNRILGISYTEISGKASGK